VLDYVGPGLLETFAHEGRIPLPLLRLKIASFWYGDLFVTTTERERYYLLGLLAASRRMSRTGYGRDDPIVRVVRMTPPAIAPAGARRVRQSDSEPLVVLLAGAFLPWYDYDLIRRAVAVLPEATRGALRLRVLGGNPRMPEAEHRVRTTLGSVEGVTPEFLGTVPFEERARFYLDADLGLSLPSAHLEDELSARTRVLDYLWAGLPLASEGKDEYSATILDGGAGFRYDHAPESLAEVLDRLRKNPDLLQSAHERCPEVLRNSFDVSKEAVPVLEFLRAPFVSDRVPPLVSSLEMAGLWAVDVADSMRRRIR
jgi:glycosyltransferase involved in cell wall biosynthesis